MPPKKRTKVSAASTPLGDSQPKTPVETPIDTSGKDQSTDQLAEDILNDPWTDEQESQLFKSLIRWKPTGIHKHFRMICISQHMRSNGYANDDPSYSHTRTPGIWTKLHQLYDLDALDERENHHLFSNEPDPHDPEEQYELPEFQLPDDEYGELMSARRFPDDGQSQSVSPPLLPEIQFTKDEPPPMSLGGQIILPEIEKEDSALQNSPPIRGRAATKVQPKSNTRNARTSRAAQTRGSSKPQSTVSDSEEDEDEEEEGEEEEEDASEDELAQQRTTRVSARRKSARGKRGR